MKNLIYLFGFIIAMLFIVSCSDDSNLGGGSDADSSTTDGDWLGSSISEDSSFGGGSSGPSGESGGAGIEGGGAGGEGGEIVAGQITAGEWNDLESWTFWLELLHREGYDEIKDNWGTYNFERVEVEVVDNTGQALSNVPLTIEKDGNVSWSAITDNQGKASLFIDPFSSSTFEELADYSLNINEGEKVVHSLRSGEEGVNKVTLINHNHAPADLAQIAFVVDATGSMGDELEYLKVEMEDVIGRSAMSNPSIVFNTAAVYYRDQDDEYLTKESDFTSNISTTIDFINSQSAGGGGDYPEAVHSALEKATGELTWDKNAITKIIFLILDAPPHVGVEASLQSSLDKAAAKGIKIIPVSASGIDKSTEFILRSFAVLTNGTYVFITNDSGIGGDHIEPTVGDYEVEFLNDLMVRLINKYIN